MKYIVSICIWSILSTLCFGQGIKLAKNEYTTSSEEETITIDYNLIGTRIVSDDKTLTIEGLFSPTARIGFDYALIDDKNAKVEKIKKTTKKTGSFKIDVVGKKAQDINLLITIQDGDEIIREPVNIKVNFSVKGPEVEAPATGGNGGVITYTLHPKKIHISVYRHAGNDSLIPATYTFRKRILKIFHKHVTRPLIVDISEIHVNTTENDTLFEIVALVSSPERHEYRTGADQPIKKRWTGNDKIFLDGKDDGNFIFLKDILEVKAENKNQKVEVDEDSGDIIVTTPLKNK